MVLILLTEQQKDIVIGKGLNGSRLNPFLYGTNYYLPSAILADNDYIEQRDFLLSLPLVELEIKDDSEL